MKRIKCFLVAYGIVGYIMPWIVHLISILASFNNGKFEYHNVILVSGIVQFPGLIIAIFHAILIPKGWEAYYDEYGLGNVKGNFDQHAFRKAWPQIKKNIRLLNLETRKIDGISMMLIKHHKNQLLFWSHSPMTITILYIYPRHDSTISVKLERITDWFIIIPKVFRIFPDFGLNMRILQAIERGVMQSQDISNVQTNSYL